MSDKFKVIDHATYERLQQSSSAGPSHNTTQKIRNAKYKRMNSTNFNLLQFVKVKERGGKSRVGGGGNKAKLKKRSVDTVIQIKVKKRGKQRENGRKKKPTRLKKSILKYRQLKRGQEKLQLQLEESIKHLTNLTLAVEDNNNDRNEAVINLPGIHSRRFRDYCDNCTTPELKQHCEQLVRELNRFQRRAYAQNEIKARAHRRFVVGFREVQNYLRINKVKLIIIATDCEHSEGEVSLDQTIQNIKTICHDQQIPIAFAFQRRQLAYILYKKASISCVGILDYDGARDIFAQLMEALKVARESYETLKQKCLAEHIQNHPGDVI